MAAYRPPGATFGTPVRIDDVAVADTVPAAQVVMDAAGRAIAVWAAPSSTGARELRAAVRPAGAGAAWSAPQIVDAGAEPVVTLVSLAIDPSGGVLALYASQSGTAGRTARVAYRPGGDGSTFGAPVSLGAAGAEYPVGAGFAADGRAVVVTSASGPQVVVRERGPGAAGVVGPPSSAPAPTGINDGAVVVRGDGSAAVSAYAASAGTPTRIVVLTRPSGGPFGPETVVAAGPAGFVPTALGLDAAGTLVPVWLDYVTPMTYRANASRAPFAGGPFAAPQPLTDTGRFANGAEINARPLAGGEVLAAWGRDRQVEYASRPSGATSVFGPARRVPGTAPSPGDVQLATDGAGDALLAFTAGGEGRVQVAMPRPERDRSAPRLVTDLTPPRRTLDTKDRLVLPQAFDEAATVTPQLVLRLPGGTKASAARVVTVRGKRTKVRSGRASTFRFPIPRAQRAYVRAQARKRLLVTVSFRARDARGNARRHLVDVAVRR
jgi:hypothetical protein